MGRKSKYYSHVEPRLEFIQGSLRSGNTERSIAKSIGIGFTSWKCYKTQFPAFSALLKKAAFDSTALVVNALYKRATGYEYDEVQITFSGPQQGQQGQQASQQRLIRKTTKQVPPDTVACIFWLINHDPDHWRNRQDIRHSGAVEGTGVLVVAPPLSKEEWLACYADSEKWLKTGQGKQDLGKT